MYRRNPTPQKLVGLGVAIMSSLVLMTACGGSSKDDSAKGSSTTTQASGSGSSASTGSAPRKVIASHDGSDDKIPLRVELNELHRKNGLVDLTFTVRNLLDPNNLGTMAKSDARWQVGDFFDDGSLHNGSKVTSTVSGLYLVDSANKKKYLTVRDSAGECLCSVDGSNIFVSAGATTVLSATFGAPPDSVKAVDVFVPGFGTFNDVPLS